MMQDGCELTRANVWSLTLGLLGQSLLFSSMQHGILLNVLRLLYKKTVLESRRQIPEGLLTCTSMMEFSGTVS